MKIRAISAIVAVAVLIAMYFFWGTQGLYVMCTIAIAIGINEYLRLTLRRLEVPKHLEVTFFIMAAATYVTTVWFGIIGASLAAAASIVYLTMVVLTVRTPADLERALRMQTAGLMGIFYCGMFPAFAVKTLQFSQGTSWFFGLLAIVFSGDTGAYLSGRFFGKTKLLEAVSPKKTIEGSIGGLCGSAVAGFVLGYWFLPGIPVWTLVLTALVTGAFAQVGDLFESLLKRVAEVKDSGHIMPGHGGILDRLDGVLFAAPIYYTLAMLLAS